MQQQKQKDGIGIFIFSYYPQFARGIENNGGLNAGMFFFDYYYGDAHQFYGAPLVLAA